MRRVLELRERGSLALPALVGGLLVLGLIGGAFLLTRPNADEPEGPQLPVATSAPEDHSLTDAEAIAEFRRLEVLSFRIFESRDRSLTDTVYASSSPIPARVLRDLRQLRRDGARVSIDSETRDLTVTRNSEEEVHLTQVTILNAQFFDHEGQRITRGSGRERQEIEWLLVFENERWRIQDARVMSTKDCDAHRC